MKHALIINWVVLLSMAILISGCSAGSAPGKPTDQTTNQTSSESSPTSADGESQGSDLMSGIQAAAWTATPQPPDRTRIEAINRFSAELFLESAGNEGNLMVSPASVYLALAMTLNGADTETRAAMLEVLAQKGLNVEQINQLSRDWIALLNRTGEKTTVAISNSIWFDQEFVPYAPFLQANADYYSAAARRLDFKNPSAPDTINSWVSDATKGLIDKIVEQIDPDVVMYLINAIYFKSDWKTPFDPNTTLERTFNAPEGAVETPFLHRNGSMTYLEGLGASGIALPYDDGQFAFFALLPDGEATPREWLAGQDPKTLFARIANQMGEPEVTVDLAMPKFESRYEDSLLNELSRLGMDIAFDPGRADFSQMNESHEKNLYISEVKHKTYVRVDEKGTEAAAVTSVEITVTSLPMSDRQLVLDRPFIYGIMDMTTGTPLFAGIMENPAGA